MVTDYDLLAFTHVYYIAYTLHGYPFTFGRYAPRSRCRLIYVGYVVWLNTRLLHVAALLRSFDSRLLRVGTALRLLPFNDRYGGLGYGRRTLLYRLPSNAALFPFPLDCLRYVTLLLGGCYTPRSPFTVVARLIYYALYHTVTLRPHSPHVPRIRLLRDSQTDVGDPITQF